MIQQAHVLAFANDGIDWNSSGSHRATPSLSAKGGDWNYSCPNPSFGSNAWRLGGLEAWRLGGLEAWRLGGLEAWQYFLFGAGNALSKLMP